MLLARINKSPATKQYLIEANFFAIDKNNLETAATSRTACDTFLVLEIPV